MTSEAGRVLAARFSQAELRDLPLESRVFGPLFLQRIQEDAQRDFLSFGERRFTYGEFGARTLALARGLASLGVGAGSIVPIALPNCPEYLMAWFALHLRGATMALFNPALRSRMLAQALIDCRPRCLIASAEGIAALNELEAPALEGLQMVIVAGDCEDPLPATGALQRAGVRALRLDDLFVADGSDPVVATRFDEVQSIFFTSGSTGPAKGVLMPNGHFFANPCTMMRLTGLTRDDVVHTSLPLFHGVGSRQGVLPSFMIGARVDLGENFSASRFWQTMADVGATIAILTPTMPPVLAAREPGPADRSHRLRALYNVAPDLAFESRFGVRMLTSFAITEIGVVIYTPYPERRLGTMGRAHEDWELAVVDEADRPVAPGTPGELVCRPKRPSIMMQGYQNRPEAAASAWRNLWYHTGDTMIADADGYFRFAGRDKDRIRRRGENISPLQIEDELRQHPAVSDCVALAHPAGDGEDDVRVVLVLRPVMQASTALPDLAAWLRPRLPASMLPRYWETLEVLPVTPSEKVDRRALRERGLGQGSWDRER